MVHLDNKLNSTDNKCINSTQQPVHTQDQRRNAVLEFSCTHQGITKIVIKDFIDFYHLVAAILVSEF